MNKLKTILTNLCRLVLALTFIFSGYVKAIDPLGTQYKIQDYLQALGIQDFAPDWLTLLTSIGLSALEFSLGIFILFAIRRRLTTKLILALLSIMTLITLWLAIANPIKDCGCFGDAIHLTNGQTLLKNVILLLCAIIVWIWPLRMVRFISKSNQWIAINFTILYILISSIYSLYKLPQFDFRPYHIGANIKKGMEIPKGAKMPKFTTTFTLEKNGKTKDFTLDNYPDSTWKFITSKTVKTEEGYVPPIHDFSIQDIKSGEDLTNKILDDKGYTFLLISPHLEQADDSNFGDIDPIYEYSQTEKIPFYCLTASDESAIQRWRELTGAEYPFCTTDETTLKTIIRSNPGLLLIKNGTIINKWSHNALPKKEGLTAPIQQLEIGQMPADSVPKKILKILLWFVLPLFILTLADRLWAWSKWIRRKENKLKQDISTLKKEKK